MTYDFNGKKIRIPDREIELNMELLEVSKEKAIQIWLEDNKFIINEQQEALTKKVEESGILHTLLNARQEPPKKEGTGTKTKKSDPDKEYIIDTLYQAIVEKVLDATIVNPAKTVNFKLNEKEFEIDLKQKRKKK